MKTALIGLTSSLIEIKSQEEVIEFLKRNIVKIGEEPSLISYGNNFNILESLLLKSDYDLIFIIGTNSAIYNHNIKEYFIKSLNEKLEKNIDCELALKEYCRKNNIVFSMEEELNAFFPTNSISLFNSEYYSNGFIYQKNSHNFVVLPSNIEFVKEFFNNISYQLNNLLETHKDNLVLHCFGILEHDIKNIIKSEIDESNTSFTILNSGLDSTIYINSLNGFLNQDIVANICTKLSKFIYSTEDTDLYETVNNLLTIQKKKIVISEMLTYGNISLNLSKINNNLIEFSYIFNSFESVLQKLKLDECIVRQFGKYSVNTVYELDNLLLQNSTSDIAVFILGHPTQDQCYIAIGDIDGIHVYKNKILKFNDSLIKNISDTTLFYLIKKLRQNDLQFR